MFKFIDIYDNSYLIKEAGILKTLGVAAKALIKHPAAFLTLSLPLVYKAGKKRGSGGTRFGTPDAMLNKYTAYLALKQNHNSGRIV